MHKELAEEAASVVAMGKPSEQETVTV